jgi:hypothetical protein
MGTSSWAAAFGVVVVGGVVAGCPDASKGPVYVPDELVGRTVRDCYSFRPEVFRGPTAPLVASHIVARCEDANLCTAELQSNGDIVVYGDAPGATTLHVELDHPTTHSHEEHHIRVVFDRPAHGGDWLHPRMRESSPNCPPRQSAPPASAAANAIASDAGDPKQSDAAPVAP